MGKINQKNNLIQNFQQFQVSYSLNFANFSFLQITVNLQVRKCSLSIIQIPFNKLKDLKRQFPNTRKL